MVHKTKGVVFRFTKYGDTSIIVTIFTELYGLQSYIVNGVRSKSSRTKIALFQPLTLLDLVVYHKENANINRIKEVHCFHPYQSIPTDIVKSAISMFLAEVINRSIKEESHAANLCEFLCSSFITLDTMESPENFHLLFMVKLSRFLGFGANTSAELLSWRITDPLVEERIRDLLRADYLTSVRLTSEQRREILDLLLKFYAEHTGISPEMKSIQVIREILR